MAHRYDGKGGSVYTGTDRQAVANELMQKAAQSAETGKTYENIGYAGHAAAARHQSEVLAKAAAKVLNGQGISDYEKQAYNG